MALATLGPMPAGGDELDLRAAAERLGVHYQTAYQWVRSGALPAVKRAGVYVVDAEDVDRLVASRALGDRPRRDVRVRDWDAQATRFAALVVAGDERSADKVVDRLVGAGVLALCERLLGPALRIVGDQWSTGAISVADEHLASGVCERILARITPNPPGRRRGICLVATVPGDDHHLPAAMASAVLAEDHWTVSHLGVAVPVDDLLAMARRRSPDLVVLSVTNPAVGSSAGEVAAAVAALGMRVLRGGPGSSLAELVARARDGLG